MVGHIDTWNRIENPVQEPQTYAQLTFDKVKKQFSGGTIDFSKNYLSNWTTIGHIFKNRPQPKSHTL